jgi:DNA repair protein RecO (recombination protein O)
MKRIELAPAYVLHRRPYRETSFLLEIFTLQHGRVALVAKGVRKARSSLQGLLQPFTPLLVSWSGKGELLTMTHAEANGTAAQLRGDCLFAGFYLNELIMNLLQKWDAHPALYARYENTLAALQSESLEETTLRSFEIGLLDELGYGLFPKDDKTLYQTFSADKFYRYTFEQGLVESALEAAASVYVFAGKNLLAIAKEEWEEVGVLRDAKRLMRLLLAPLLGARPLYSRKLFIKQDDAEPR